jgi:hypothetical protein
MILFSSNVFNTHGILDLGLQIAESIDNQRNPQSAIPNPKSVVYIHIYELAFNQAVVKNLGKINVESFS